jgi:hypothetical protein
LPDASSPTGPARAIKDAVAKARTPLRLIGWLIMIALFAKWGLSYFQSSVTFDQQIDRAVILVGFSILLIFSLIQQYQGHRPERYADITSSLHKISHELRDLVLVELCDSLG